MKILLIMPSIKPDANLYEKLIMKFTMWSPLTLQCIASLTDDCHELTIIDENYRKIRYSDNYDIVAISTFTSTALHAYEIADEFRRRCVKVVLGGYHPTALPEEAKKHADAVVIGEAEGVWKKILEDAEKDELNSFYISPANNSFISSPSSHYNGFFVMRGVEATRGCIYKCNFCSISNSPMGCRFRKKPVERVVKEIESIKCRGFVFYDSSLTLDMEYTKELFREIKHLNKKFACFGNADALLRDEELLEISYNAGCVAWAVGFESVSPNTLKKIGKKSNKIEEYGKIVKKINDCGMALIGSFVFGFDDDTPDTFNHTLNMLYRWNIDSIGVNILTPFPGTPLFKKLESEKRILTKDWSKYDLYHVVFQPKKLTPQEIYDGINEITEDFFSLKNIIKKFFGKNFGIVTKSALLYHIISSKIVYKICFEKNFVYG
ncbi:MAG TPA: B12-binding domain-containing radical SAM protein [Thermoplasmatales archaeon]|nr:B12-binding domain-containing radical SAM protein [Thermoplasmatales archaeon]